MITRLKLEQFTVFRELTFEPSPGINILVGENGVGKTHLMKVAYAACDVAKTRQDFAEKLVQTFLPSERRLGRLVHRKNKSSKARVEISRKVGGNPVSLALGFSSHVKDHASPNITREFPDAWFSDAHESVYIPVKEMLSHGPGFRSLYARREIHFEAIYNDVLERAYLPALRGPIDATRKSLLALLEDALDGKVAVQNEEFFLKNKRGNLEFTLLAEGLRKLGLLWILIQNGVLIQGSTLFWDEPESNLNPKLLKSVIQILLELETLGVQIFVSTHSYPVLKEFELAATEKHQIRYFSLHRSTPTADIELSAADQPFLLEENPIINAMTSLYDREVMKSLGDKK